MTRHLPQPDALVVPENKILGYLLNPNHKDGASKNRYFRNRGFSPDKWEEFASALRQHGATQPITHQTKTKYGTSFTVECHIDTPDGKNPCILSAWIQVGQNAPHLVTAHPNS